MNQQEKNRKTLTDAIRRLPTQEAPKGLWEQIRTDLDSEIPPEQNRQVLQQAVHDLPQRQAPDQVWKKIERILDGRKSRSRIIPAAVSVAAALALIFSVWILWPEFPEESVTPIAETESPFAMPTEASLNEWQHVREQEEERVFACLDQANESPQTDSLANRYQQISTSLDSLAILLQQPEVHDATLGRFQRLESSRKQILARIEQLCGDAQP